MIMCLLINHAIADCSLFSRLGTYCVCWTAELIRMKLAGQIVCVRLKHSLAYVTYFLSRKTE